MFMGIQRHIQGHWHIASTISLSYQGPTSMWQYIGSAFWRWIIFRAYPRLLKWMAYGFLVLLRANFLVQIYWRPHLALDNLLCMITRLLSSSLLGANFHVQICWILIQGMFRPWGHLAFLHFSVEAVVLWLVPLWEFVLVWLQKARVGAWSFCEASTRHSKWWWVARKPRARWRRSSSSSTACLARCRSLTLSSSYRGANWGMRGAMPLAPSPRGKWLQGFRLANLRWTCFRARGSAKLRSALGIGRLTGGESILENGCASLVKDT